MIPTFFADRDDRDCKPNLFPTPAARANGRNNRAIWSQAGLVGIFFGRNDKNQYNILIIL